MQCRWQTVPCWKQNSIGRLTSALGDSWMHPVVGNHSRRRPGKPSTGIQSSRRYTRAVPWIHFNARPTVPETPHCHNGSQWRRCRLMVVVWSPRQMSRSILPGLAISPGADFSRDASVIDEVFVESRCGTVSETMLCGISNHPPRPLRPLFHVSFLTATWRTTSSTRAQREASASSTWASTRPRPDRLADQPNQTRMWSSLAYTRSPAAKCCPRFWESPPLFVNVNEWSQIIEGTVRWSCLAEKLILHANYDDTGCRWTERGSCISMHLPPFLK